MLCSMASNARPEFITGGCLCKAIQYKISFSPDSDWPPADNGTCQCTMCRKAMGSILPQLITIPTQNIQPPLSSFPTYKTYRSSSFAKRSFCSECGSPLTYMSDNAPNDTELYVGNLDEDVLCGQKTGKKIEDETGIRAERDGKGYGKQLLYAKQHLFCENMVEGVTDRLPGKMYWRGSKGGKGFDGAPVDN